MLFRVIWNMNVEVEGNVEADSEDEAEGKVMSGNVGHTFQSFGEPLNVVSIEEVDEAL